MRNLSFVFEFQTIESMKVTPDMTPLCSKTVTNKEAKLEEIQLSFSHSIGKGPLNQLYAEPGGLFLTTMAG